MQDETSTFDDDVDALLAEQERLQSAQKKPIPLKEATKAAEVYQLMQLDKKVAQVKLSPSPIPLEINNKQVLNTVSKTNKSTFNRKILFIIVPLLGLLFLGFYLPSFIVAAGYGPEIVNSILKPFGLKATFDVVTLEWTKPVDLKNIKLTRLTPFETVKPKENQLQSIKAPLDMSRLMELETFQTSKTLWEIVQSPKNPGPISLNKPKGQLILSSDDKQQAVNNWTDIINNFTKSKNENKTITPVEIHILEGELEIQDLNKSQLMKISNLKMDLLNNINQEKQVISKTGSCLTEFNLSVDNQSRPFVAQAAWTEKAGNLSLKSEQFPLSLLQPYIHHYQPDYQLTGQATGLVSLQWVHEPVFQLSQADLSINADLVAFTCHELSPKIVTVPKLLLKCSPRISSQAPDNTQNSSAQQPASQIPSSWELTAILDRPMLITPVPPDQQNASQNYIPVWDDQEVNLYSQLEFQGFNSQPKTPETSSLPQSQLIVREFKLNSQSASLQANGTISDISQLPVIDLQLAGVINTGKVFPVIDPKFAQQFQFDGLKLTAGRIQGPLQLIKPSSIDVTAKTGTPPDTKQNLNGIELAIMDLPANTAQFTCNADFQFQRAKIAGISFEQGVLNALYAGDTLKLTPGGLKVMEGDVRLQPTIQFLQHDILIHHPEGKIWDHARLTREFSQEYLKYASPLFAEATAINGEFSFAIPKSTFSLNQLLNPQLNKDIYLGVIEFHQAKVGPGALFGEIAQLVESIRAITGKQGVLGVLQQGATWVDMPMQKVKLQMNQGRIYHDQMIFQISNIPLVSNGSVGLQNQTLDITMNLTLPESDKKVLKLIANQNIELKLSGTTKQPRLDKGSLANWGKNLGTGAAFNLIENLIERKREKQGK